MKKKFAFPALAFLLLADTNLFAQAPKNPCLFIDVHFLQPGSVSVADAADAHAGNLAAQDEYGVQFLRYWVDEKAGVVYCLSLATDSAKIAVAHRNAQSLLPQQVYAVTDGKAGTPRQGWPYFLDVRQPGAGNATAAVAEAHERALAVQQKPGVNFINCWVDEKKGVAFCLFQAKDGSNVVQTRKEPHGPRPNPVEPVKQSR